MMKNSVRFIKQKAQEFRMAFLSGFLVGTSYIPFPPWALLFCYTPLWLYAAEDNRKIKNAVWAAWICQFTLTLIGFHWIAYTAHEFGQIPWIPSALTLLLFCAFMHLYIPASVGLSLWLKRRLTLSTPATLFVMALSHAILERVWPVIFQWNLGYTYLWAKLPAYQLADIIGFEGLSSLTLILNAWVAVIWLKRRQLKVAFSHLGALTGLFLVLNFWGFQHVRPWNDFDREIRATVIQANIGNTEKIYAEKGRGYQEAILRQFLDLSEKALGAHPQTDILIWPETAFPDYLNTHLLQRKHPQILAENLAKWNIPLITGAYSRDPNSDTKKDQSTYNALFLVGPTAESLDKPYHKTELLAFGEYLPLSETFPFLLKLLPFVSNFGRGNGPQQLRWNHKQEPIDWGGQICYEGLYPEFTRGLAQGGTEILVNVTNDSWFGRPSEPYQHLYMTFGRAIEVRRPLIRSTNTGISTGILANGEVLQRSPLHKEWWGEFVLKYKHEAPLTFYTLYGHRDWILLLLALAIILGGPAYARVRRP